MALGELKKKTINRRKRGMRVRKHIRDCANRPRLSVVKSNKHIQAQLIDDERGITLGGVATYSKEFRTTEFNKRGKDAARKLGERIAEIAKEKGVKEVVLDRGSSKYHGVVAELADAARAGGLQF